MEKSNKKNLLKFLAGSGFGLFMFMCPVGAEGAFETPLSILTDLLDKAINANMPWLLILMVALSAFGSLACLFVKPEFITKRAWLADSLYISVPYVITRLIAFFVTLCVFGDMGPHLVNNPDVGGNMTGLAGTLIALAITLSIVLPFLTDVGIMEFTGIIMKPLIRPLFKVPGRASVDLIASWLASSNTAVLITGNQYHGGYYSRREAATIMTNFSLVSIPFCMVVAETLGLSQKFPFLYLTVTAIGLFLAIVGARIWPLGTIPDAYCGEKKINEEKANGDTLLGWAINEALQRAEKFTIGGALYDGGVMAVGIILDIIPIVIAWGTIGTLLVNETPIFQFLAYPMGAYMSILGVEDAFGIAPQTLVGFIDMFIPALVTSPDLPEKTRFLVAGISLVQIIYMTEVGSIIVKSNVGLDIKRLFVIFIERTIIAIPLIVLASNWL